MNRITLYKKDIHKGPLILVNSQYPFLNEYAQNITDIFDNESIQLEKTTANILKAILNKIDITSQLHLVSGYRTLQEQIKIYEDSLQENGIEFTSQYVALPCHSEHQTGYAIDLAYKADYTDFIRPQFYDDGVCKTFKEESIDYGFIARYQEDKKEITMIASEPWHFRYVGIPHARVMYDRDLCLEEYLESLKSYTLFHPLIISFHHHLYKLCYIPVLDEKIEIMIPDNQYYQISGNNYDGFILTTWGSYV